jgi:hypothetical protein
MRTKTTRAPALRFSPTAWAKLLFLRDLDDTEVGGFGLTAAGDLLYVQDLVLVQQRCTPTSVRFEDESVADFFDRQCDHGLRPEQFARVWVHTHPGDSPLPSRTDEETFGRVFGECEWAIMFILAEYGESYARLAFHTGPGGSLELPVEVDFAAPFAGSDPAAWELEYLENVVREEPLRLARRNDHWPQPAVERERQYDMAWDSWWDAEDLRRQEAKERLWQEAEEQYWQEEALFYE